jgi:hypothetical protein
MSAPTVVLVHGTSADASSWHGVIVTDVILKAAAAVA